MNAHRSRRLHVIFALLSFMVLFVSGTGNASVHEQFVHKYAEFNTGNWAYDFFDFPESTDKVNAFNRGLVLELNLGKSYPVNADFKTQMTLRYGSNAWEWSDSNGAVTAEPRSPFFNAGFGWNLGFGRIIAPSSNPYGSWLYESPDGRLIRFYDTRDGISSTINVFYSRDSSNLRLRLLDNGSRVSLDFPNGTTHDFLEQEGNWEIHKRYDQFGNYQRFTYRLELNRVTTADNHGRIQWIHFKPDPSGYFDRIIDKIRLTRSVSGVQIYTFNYTTMSVDLPAAAPGGSSSTTITIPALLSVTTSPDGGNLASFEYHVQGTLGQGLLSRYTNEHGGSLSYSYANISMPYVQNPHNLQESMNHYAAEIVGISTRDKFDLGDTLLGQWSFHTAFIGGARSEPPSLVQPTGIRTQAMMPDGFSKYKYFRVAITNSQSPSPQEPQSKYSYAFPGKGDGLFMQLTELTIQQGVSWGEGLRERSFKQIAFKCPTCLDPGALIVKTDEVSKDAPTIIRIFDDFSFFNIAGKVIESDSVNSAPSTTTNYEFELSPPGTLDLWISKPATHVSVSNGVEQMSTEFCVNQLGQITRKRRLRGINQAPNDFIEANSYDESGNLIRVQYLGGDTQLVANGSLCDLNLPSPSFAKYKEYKFGSISEEGYLDNVGNNLRQTYRATIDKNTGLVLTASDASDFTFTYSYDKRNRLTQVSLPVGHGQRESISYARAIGSTPAYVTTTNTSEDWSEILLHKVVRFSGFGKPIAKEVLGPEGWSVTTKTYDAMGRITTVTSPDGGVTHYLNRDYRGRPGIIRPPHGVAHDKQYTYSGNTTTNRKWIAKDPSSSPPVEEYRDLTTTFDRNRRPVSQLLVDQDGESRIRTTSYGLSGNWLTKTENGNSITNLALYDQAGYLVQDSYGSAYTYNSLGQPMQEYGAYGDKIDLTYDDSGRLIAKSNSGNPYIEYYFADENSSGELNKHKLVTAIRYNRNILDIEDGVVKVEDTFLYGGKGGRISHRNTSIKLQDGTLLGQYFSHVEYTDDGKVLRFHSPTCVGNEQFVCDQPNKTIEYDYVSGLLSNVSLIDDGVEESWVYGITYDLKNRPIQYSFDNGLTTQLSYDERSDVPSAANVFDISGSVWSFDTTEVDGNGLVTWEGQENLILDDYYKPSALVPQPTQYLTKSSNSQNRQDPLGMVTAETNHANCASGYPPCVNISVFDFQNSLVWRRNRPFSWPSSPIGLKTPSYLYFSDVLGRSGALNQGNATYFNDRQNYQISLEWTLHYESGRTVTIFGEGDFSLGTTQGAGSMETNSYIHSDFFSRNYGLSDTQGEFRD